MFVSSEDDIIRAYDVLLQHALSIILLYMMLI